MYNKVKSISSIYLLLLLLILCSCKSIETDIHIFSSIEECQSIKRLKDDDADVIIYDSPANDKHLKELAFQERFGCKYTSDELTFELFAYEFTDSNIAMAYFENVTGKKQDPNPTFLDSSGMHHFSRIVVVENKAYAVYCENADKDDLIKFINSWFSVDY